MATADYAIFPSTNTTNGLVPLSSIKTKYVRPILTGSTDSDYSQVRALWTREMFEYEIDSRLMSDAAREQAAGFLLARGLGVDAFLYRDRDFYRAVNVTFGTGNDDTRLFQLKASLASHLRTATMIDPLTVTVYDNTQTVPGADYMLNDEQGTVLFDFAPAAGHVLSATFEFYIKVRLINPLEFDRDTKVSSTSKFTLREVR